MLAFSRGVSRDRSTISRGDDRGARAVCARIVGRGAGGLYLVHWKRRELEGRRGHGLEAEVVRVQAPRPAGPTRRGRLRGTGWRVDFTAPGCCWRVRR